MLHAASLGRLGYQIVPAVMPGRWFLDTEKRTLFVDADFCMSEVEHAAEHAEVFILEKRVPA